MIIGNGIGICFKRFVAGGLSVSIGSGPFTTGTTLTATVNGLQGGETVAYQWTDDGVNIPGATASSYTASIGTDGVAELSQMRVSITVNGGNPIQSAPRQITNDVWAFSGSIISQIPANAGWGFSGSIVTTIGDV